MLYRLFLYRLLPWRRTPGGKKRYICMYIIDYIPEIPMGTLQIKERYSYAAGEWREPFAEAQVPYDELMGFAKFAATLALRLRLRWSKSNQKRPAAVPTEHNCRSVIQHISPSPEGGPKIRRFQARCSPTAGVPYRSLRVALGPANLMRGAMPCQARDFDSDSVVMSLNPRKWS